MGPLVILLKVVLLSVETKGIVEGVHDLLHHVDPTLVVWPQLHGEEAISTNPEIPMYIHIKVVVGSK